MKKMAELMQEIGFNKDSSTGAQEAFLKHLIFASTGTRVLTPTEHAEIKADPVRVKQLPLPQEQMSFGFISEKLSRKKA
jgi:hypothetical protein